MKFEKTLFENKFNISRIEKIARNINIPLSYSQQRLWFLDQLKPNDPSFNIPTVIRVKGKLNNLNLEKALNLLIEKYEILRTSFEAIEGKPYQKINSSYKLKIKYKHKLWLN